MADGGLPISTVNYTPNPLLNIEAYTAGAKTAQLVPSPLTSILSGAIAGEKMRIEEAAAEAKNKYYEQALEIQRANAEAAQARASLAAEKFGYQQKRQPLEDQIKSNDQTLKLLEQTNRYKKINLDARKLLEDKNKEGAQIDTASLFGDTVQKLDSGNPAAIIQIAPTRRQLFKNIQTVAKLKNGNEILQRTREAVDNAFSNPKLAKQITPELVDMADEIRAYTHPKGAKYWTKEERAATAWEKITPLWKATTDMSKVLELSRVGNGIVPPSPETHNYEIHWVGDKNAKDDPNKYLEYGVIPSDPNLPNKFSQDFAKGWRDLMEIGSSINYIQDASNNLRQKYIDKNVIKREETPTKTTPAKTPTQPGEKTPIKKEEENLAMTARNKLSGFSR